MVKTLSVLLANVTDICCCNFSNSCCCN